ncbi:uncharacterized protein [Rutidosis leptorrhynchoides]|uniref:uncharacterized protein n=1 Tax=Rutidosis leptorrhynchoides TaxID=125765 RepID=UPI003A994B6F
MASLVAKVDFEKAYDTVSWTFLDYMLDRMGFGQIWRAWIRMILYSSRTSILVNGSLTNEFSIKCGLRQGDPLSPFLFLIMMEGLESLIKDSVRSGLIKAAKFDDQEFKVTHLFYADNVVFISDWCRQSLDGIMETEVENFSIHIGCSIGAVPFMYLDLPVGTNMNRISGWIPLREKFIKKLSGWKMKSEGVLPNDILCVKVGNGRNTWFWLDDWKGSGTFKEKYNRLYHLETNKECFIADRLVNGEWKWEWNRAQIGARNTSILATLTTKVLGERTIWCKLIPRKVNIFAWRVKLDRLPSRSNISERGMHLEALNCVVCGHTLESSSHVLFECPLALDIWRSIRIWVDLSLPSFKSWLEWETWFEALRASKDMKNKLYVIIVVSLWHIWRYRNATIFDPNTVKKSFLFDSIRIVTFRWICSRNSCKLNWNLWLVKPL